MSTDIGIVLAQGPTPQAKESVPPSDLPIEMLPTGKRSSLLHQKCLQRDGHRCIVTREFDQKEAIKRHKASRQAPVDDEGESFSSPNQPGFTFVEACHILPRALTQGGAAAGKEVRLLIFGTRSTSILLNISGYVALDRSLGYFAYV